MVPIKCSPLIFQGAMVEKTKEMELICVVKPQALIVEKLSSAWRML